MDTTPPITLTEARTRANLSMVQLAGMVGKSRSTVWRWEQPGLKDEPSSSDLDAIGKGCRLSSIEQQDLASHFTARKDAA